MLKQYIKKAMHNTDIQYLRSVIHHKYTFIMHNLKSNFDKFFNITKSVFKNRIDSFDNFFFYPNKPKNADEEAFQSHYVVSVLKEETSLQASEVIDAGTMNISKRRDFYEREIQDTKDTDIMLS